MKFSEILFLFILFMTPIISSAREELIDYNGKKVYLLDAKEGYDYLIQSDFIDGLSNLDISLRMKKDFSQTDPSKAAHAYSNFVNQQIKDWSGREKKYLKKRVKKVFDQMNQYTPSAIPDTLYLIKSTGDQEFNAFYTVKNAIIFPGLIGASAKIFFWSPYFKRLIERKILHESFHIFSTNHPNSRIDAYKIFGFSPISNLVLPPEIKNRLITNPDDKGIEYKIDLTDTLSGETQSFCLLIFSKYPTWVGYKDFSARVNVMLDYLEPKLLAIKPDGNYWTAMIDSTTGQPLTIRVQDSKELQQKISVSINAIQSPEEIVAKAYVVLMRHLIKNKESKNQSAPAKEKLKALKAILNH